MKFFGFLILVCLLVLFGVRSARAAEDHREGITNMYSQCRCVMEGGECRVYNRPPAKPGTKVFTSVGPISAAAYNAIRLEGGMMCEGGQSACTTNWDGDKCRAFRTMFRQEPTVCVPGPGARK
jgi:hypothetical protein